MAMPRPPNPYSFPSLPVDESLNFRADLFTDTHRHLLKDLVTVGSGGYVGILCYGMPIPTHLLETMVDFQLKPTYMRVKLLATPIVEIAIMANHYHNSYGILQETKARFHEMYSGATKHRLVRSFQKLCRRLPVAVNANEIIDCLETPDVTFGTMTQCLSQLNQLREAADLSPSEDTRARYGTLTAYNLLYVPPRFLTSRGVSLYSENLGDITRKTHAPMRSLIMDQRPRTAATILDDMSFAVSMAHLCVRHKLELQQLRSWIWAKCNELVDDAYFVYTQAPEVKDAFLNVMASMRLTQSDPRMLAYQNMLGTLLDFLQAVYHTGIYAVPKFMRFCAFNLISYLQRAVGPHRGDEESSGDSSSSEDVAFDVDPTPERGETIYITKNPYGVPELFKVPSDLAGFLKKRNFVRRDVMYNVYLLDSGRVSTRAHPVKNIYSLMLEGGSRQTGTTSRNLSEIAEKTPRGHNVVTEEFVDLFADVQRRDAPSSSSTSSTASTSSSSRESLLEQAPRQRRYISVAAFAPYSAARLRTGRRRLRLPRGPAHTSNSGPDTLHPNSEADSGPDPRDELVDQIRQL
ncbi:tegument protein UL35 [Aotine betaherpesvirus 1]|uniref:Tegument protein UL35 n=1 Tax=Aotine betaherpesvirus 1 TaxID=50290 RepID=G8XUB0_9BETA|nr:tegument protein UL35 [Aotine betaherpesvirus 1]AEV80741.1 tegument protein UL35 [Aotine betaherpesvirus 1]